MKAAQLTSYEGPSAVVTNNIDQPSITDDQVLVEVRAAAVNPFDNIVAEGGARNWVELTLPATIGGDLAGVVNQVGAEVTGFSVGQEVYGSANALSGQGSFAEFAPVKADSLATKPANLDFISAAAYPLVAVSAYQALIETAQLAAGQKVLIHGGAGGIGSMAIQIAKSIGAHIATTASPESFDYVKDLGADEVIDYKTQDFSELLKDYDVVYDTVGGETNTKSYKILKPGGRLISMTTEPDEALEQQYGVVASHQATKVNTERLENITQLIEAGKLNVHVDKTFQLEQASEALAQLKAGGVRGKLIIDLNS